MVAIKIDIIIVKHYIYFYIAILWDSIWQLFFILVLDSLKKILNNIPLNRILKNINCFIIYIPGIFYKFQSIGPIIEISEVYQGYVNKDELLETIKWNPNKIVPNNDLDTIKKQMHDLDVMLITAN